MSAGLSLPPSGVPAPIMRVIDTMASFEAGWCLCGGWAIDAWLGRQTREHHDVDIAVFEHDIPALARHLDGWQLIAPRRPRPG